MSKNTVARNDLARVFLFKEGVYKCCTPGEFMSCMSVDALSQDRGDVTKIECPSPTKYGEFEEVSIIPGELGRMTTTLTGRMQRDQLSLMYSLFIRNCPIDMHLHFGLCQRPDDFNKFDKAMIFEDVYVTSFSTEALVALQSGDRAVINESVDISIGKFYEIVNLAYNKRLVVTTSTSMRQWVCDKKSCGSICDDTSDGCQKIIAVDDDNILYTSTDGGFNWSIKGVLTPASGALPTTIQDVRCFKDYFVVTYANGVKASIQVQNVFNLLNGVAATPVQVITTPAITGITGTIVSVYANSYYLFAATSGGDIYATNQPYGTWVLVESTGATLKDIYSTDDVTVAVGYSGTFNFVFYSVDGEVWFHSQVIPTLTGGNGFNAVLVKSRNNWMVGAMDGNFYCTDDGGRNWSKVKFGNSESIAHIEKATNHVIFMTTTPTSYPTVKLYRSIDGGATWIVEPNTNTGVFPLFSTTHQIATCQENPNFVLIGGADTTNAGQVVLGYVAKAGVAPYECEVVPVVPGQVPL